MNKYELTNETMEYEGHTLHRIRALQDIKGMPHFVLVQKGELGGWVESTSNLSDSDGSWIANNAKVYGDAFVCNNALVCNDAVVKDSNICNNAIVCDQSNVSGGMTIGGYTRISGKSIIRGSFLLELDKYSGQLSFHNALITPVDDFIIVTGLGLYNPCVTLFYKTIDGNIRVESGSIKGNIKEFKKALKSAYRKDYCSKVAKKYIKEQFKMIKVAKIHFN